MVEYRSNLLSKTLAFGSLLVTLLVVNGIGYDPVNLPKMFLLTILAGLALGIWIYSPSKLKESSNKSILWLAAFLICALILNLILGKAPLAMNFYGTHGRNTGVLTYISLTIIMLSALFLVKKTHIERVIKYFFMAYFFNIAYGILVVITKKDPFPWSNPYGNFLGTFGNPNFISAFLGIGFSIAFTYAIQNKNRVLQILLYIILVINVFLIVQTRSLQGLIVVGIGSALVLFFYLRERFSNLVLRGYTVFVVLLSGLSIFGMLQIGPLAKFLYKSSVSIRGEYWNAGFNMFLSSPIWGLGLDSYGDFYRRMREPSALVLPGVSTVTDSAHNVVVDIAASGGLLLLIPYLAIQLIVAKKSIEYFKKSKKFDRTFISLFVGWIGYHAQSIVSINQIGLAIWGWIFTGLILAYVMLDEFQENQTKNRDKGRNSNSQELLPAGNYLSVIALTVAAVLTALPPIVSERSWRLTLKSSNIEEIIKATNSWPQTNVRYIQTAQILLRSNLSSECLTIVRDGIKFDPDFRDYWFFLYTLTVDEKEKNLALMNLKRLDPLNKKQI